jgi:hypothetical protein
MSWIKQIEEKYTLLTPDFFELDKLCRAVHDLTSIEAENRILDLRKVEITADLSINLKALYESHAEAQKSCIVIINDKEDMGSLEDFFVVVPTITEAIDYLYMEELERNF